MFDFSALRRALLVMAIPVVATGCSDVTGPEAEPEPQFATVYDLVVETRYIEVRGSCDTDFLGNSNPGEFQYRILVYGEGQEFAQQSRGYNSVTGENFQRNAGNTINFGNKSYRWGGLETTNSVSVKLHGAEWDGVSKDDRMKDRSGSVKVPFALGSKTRAITIGASSACQIKLFYDATWAERQVPVN